MSVLKSFVASGVSIGMVKETGAKPRPLEYSMNSLVPMQVCLDLRACSVQWQRSSSVDLRV